MSPSATRVCFVHGHLGRGGAEVLRLSVLQEMVRRSMAVEVVQLRGEGPLTEDVKALGVPVTTLGNRGGLLDLAGVSRLRKFLQQRQFDIVQSSQFVTNLHTRLACRSLGIRNHIIEEHGIYSWKKFYHRWLDRQVNSQSAAVIACSKRVAESAAQHLNLPVDQIDVIPNCVGADHLRPIQACWRDSSAGRQQRAELVSGQAVEHLTGIVGTLRWEKGHRFLLEAWQQMQQSGMLTAGHHLLVVGDGPHRKELEALAEPLPNVHFLGSLPEPRSILVNLDLFVLPSVNEGFGIAIIEAMAAGVPVIASDSGGIPEVITPETGILVPAADSVALAEAMQQVIFAKDSASMAMTTAARQRVERCFTPAAYVDQLQSVYKRIDRSNC